MELKSSAVLPYDPKWIIEFSSIRDRIYPLIRDLLVGFVHVGSTAVIGLAAKPVIDIDAIYGDPSVLPEIIQRLETAGYQHVGDRGIEGREAFKAPRGFRHNLYVCKDGCLALRNHLALRDHLRSYPKDRDFYGQLKLELAPLYESSPLKYMEAKTEFILSILRQYDLSDQELRSIELANKVTKSPA